MKKENNRKELALRAANNRARIPLLAGAALGCVGIMIVFSMSPPPGSPREMVMAQAVRGESMRNLGATNRPGAVPVEKPNPAPVESKSPGSLITEIMSAPPLEKTAPVPVGFDTLSSFPFAVNDGMMDGKSDPDPQATSLKIAGLIPPRVRAFDGKVVALTGFMLPLKFKHRLVTDFLLLKNQNACCYGTVPKINEWVPVHMTGEGVQQRMDQPVTIQGSLHVGEVRENGFLVGIYRLEGERMTGPTQ